MFARGRRSPEAVFAPMWVSVRGCKCTHGNADAETHTTFRQRHRYRKRRRARDIQAETHTTHTVTVVANGVLKDTETQRHRDTETPQDQDPTAAVHQLRWRGRATHRNLRRCAHRKWLWCFGNPIAMEVCSFHQSTAQMLQYKPTLSSLLTTVVHVIMSSDSVSSVPSCVHIRNEHQGWAVYEHLTACPVLISSCSCAERYQTPTAAGPRRKTIMLSILVRNTVATGRARSMIGLHTVIPAVILDYT